ncbi:MauE/DoxX family redox-associated membrane protein [Fodinibius halophilus]|uniref:Methylamine utilisation protein MauE domain-containing protein n=1 Tax=Fodinibius halophilus TaxID=1736908 RepID=A0A6M1T202_9BACT|nr:MauE/DoxX family redox-associated membrane protein [Fodinibius halophilus]NGP90088.1 hypothetical protein [Fodinibius halophilus]
MKLEAVYNIDTDKICYLLRKGIGGLFILSASIKVLAADYMIDLIFTLMPTGWIGWMSEGLLLTGLLVLITVEILLGILLLRGIWLAMVLSATILFFTLMIFLNGYQWWSNASDCGCLGGWISISPEVTTVKTFVLLVMTVYLKFMNQGFGRFNNLSTNQ